MAMLDKEQTRPSRTETRTGLNAAHQQLQIDLLKEQSNVSALQSKLENVRKQVARRPGIP